MKGMSVFQSLKAALQPHPSESSLRVPGAIEAPAGFAPIRLRQIELEDQEEWNEVRWRNKTWLQPWESGDPMHASAISFAQWVRRERQGESDGTGAVFLIEYQGHIVGQLSLGAISYGAMRTATMGYWMDERWIGHGFAPLAVAMASDWALTDPSGPRLHRIEIAILPENRRSKRVVEKLRARYEGVRLRYMYINGVWRDHEVFVLMTEDIQESVLARLQH
jgi:ribosomal-protein-alanine N-acetyltransferase